MKLGILGGTFNPVHLGHLILADEAKEKLGLDKIIFVPAALAPHKDNADTADAGERMKMLKFAVRGNKDFLVSDLEIKRPGPSYTIDTIRALKKEYPLDELYFIIGADLLPSLDEWKDLDEIIKMAQFVVAARPGHTMDKVPSYIRTLPMRAIDIAGFQVRSCVKEDRAFRYLVPEPVFKYIKRKRLYR